MTEISLFRLYLLRGMYLFLVVGLGSLIWPGIIRHASDTPLMNGVVSCLLGAVSVLAAIGIRYPLQMLPLLLFELIWKSIWLAAFAFPLWRAGALDADTSQTVSDCLVGLVLVPIIPWRYVFHHYVKQPGDRWRASEGATAS
jgi:hypothetical protein